jgi:hypothetical protein
MNHQPVAVEVGDLQVQRFLKAQTTGIDRGQESRVMQSVNRGQDLADLFAAEHRRQALFSLSAQKVEEMPIALEAMDEEEMDPALTDPHRVRGPVIDVFAG